MSSARVMVSAAAGFVAVAAATAVAASASPAVPVAAAVPTPCSFACTDSPADVAVRSGTAEAQAGLQAVLQRTPAGGTVALPGGTFVIARPVAVPSGVTLVGGGMDATILRLDPAKAANFRYGFMLTSAQPGGALSTDVTVRALTVDGARLPAGATTAQVPAESGGGIKLGSRWRVDQVRLSNVGYFKVWLKDVDNVSVTATRFEETTGVASDKDNIGGGNVRGALISNNYFGPSARGNAIDLVRGSGVQIVANTVQATPAQPHNIYLEGVTDAVISANTLTASSISVQSNAGYADQTAVVNPANVLVQGNSVTGSASQGISVRYDAPRAGQAATAASGAVGGGNRVLGNTVTGAQVAGIIDFAAADGLVGQPDEVSGNTVVDPFARGSATWNCGYGITQAAGIVVAAGQDTLTESNTVKSSSAPGTVRYGLQVGVSSARGVHASAVGSSTTVVVGVPQAVYRAS